MAEPEFTPLQKELEAALDYISWAQNALDGVATAYTVKEYLVGARDALNCALRIEEGAP